MLKAMRKLELGLLEPQLFQREEATKKIFELRKSPHFQVEQVRAGAITALDLTADGRLLLVGGYNGTLHIYRTWEPKQSMEFKMKPIQHGQRFHDAFVYRTQWHPADSGMYSSSSRDGNLAIWYGEEPLLPVIHFGNVKTEGREKYICHHMNPHNPPIIAAGCMDVGGFHIIDLRLNVPSLRVASYFPNPIRNPVRLMVDDEVAELQWSSVNQNLLCVGTTRGRMYEVDIRSSAGPLMNYCDPPSTPPLVQSVAHNATVSSVQYGRNGGELFSLGLDGKFKKWSTVTGRLLGKCLYNESRSVISRPLSATRFFEGLRARQSFKDDFVNPSFSLTEKSNPPVAFVPAGGDGFKLVDLNEMSTLSNLKTNMRNHNTTVYDSANHTLFCGGDILSVYKSAESYKSWVTEVRGHESFVNVPLINMSGL